jgi:hypothetical protein
MYAYCYLRRDHKCGTGCRPGSVGMRVACDLRAASIAVPPLRCRLVTATAAAARRRGSVRRACRRRSAHNSLITAMTCCSPLLCCCFATCTATSAAASPPPLLHRYVHCCCCATSALLICQLRCCIATSTTSAAAAVAWGAALYMLALHDSRKAPADAVIAAFFSAFVWGYLLCFLAEVVLATVYR